MESLIFADSPLAHYLEETEGKTEYTTTAKDEPPPPSSTTRKKQKSFAPTGRPTLKSRLSSKLPQPLRLSIPNSGPVARIHEVCSRAVNSRLGRADNAKFLEHFRYILVASQLLNEQHGNAGNRASFVPSLHGSGAHLEEFRAAATSVAGAVVTATTAFASVWLIHWSKHGRSNAFSKGRVLTVISAFILLAVVLYSYAKRQWLQYLRQNAVDAASTLVTNFQAFESSSSTALQLVQEVELVSRGYRISVPLPPVTRIESQSPGKRCAKIRKCLHRAYAANLSPFREACNYLKALISGDDLDKYLEVYDINSMDIEEARLGYTTDEFEDPESLKALRVFQARLGLLRRIFLCSLLSLEATGGQPDYSRWRIAVDCMERLASTTGEWAEKLNLLLAEEEQFLMPTPATPQRPSKQVDPERERIRSQVRKLGSLSSGVRGLQAKLQLLREESTKSLDENDDISDLGPSLLSQYDSIGADLKNLLQSWESGKAGLSINIHDRRESRRMSRVSSGLRSPVLSLGGITAVDEGGSPSDALRALEGNTPVRAVSSSSGGSPANSATSEEIFEAIAIPRNRHSLGSMSREQRLAKMQEERERMNAFRERREQGMSMIRELESVINLKPNHNKRATISAVPVSGRMTSM